MKTSDKQRASYKLQGLGKLEKNTPHREAIPRPSGLCVVVPQPLRYRVPPVFRDFLFLYTLQSTSLQSIK
jgi:hypothetical protein